MAYPDIQCGDVDLPVVCCHTIWDQGQALLDAISQPVLDCMAECACCGTELQTFVSLGRPETWQTDFIAVWLNGLSYSNSSLRPSGGMVIRPDLRVEWNVLLWESNYPGLQIDENDVGIVPSFEDWNAANHHAYAHGEALMRGILDFAVSDFCGGFVLRGFGPATPEAYNAGWVAGVALDCPF